MFVFFDLICFLFFVFCFLFVFRLKIQTDGVDNSQVKPVRSGNLRDQLLENKRLKDEEWKSTHNPYSKIIFFFFFFFFLNFFFFLIFFFLQNFK